MNAGNMCGNGAMVDSTLGTVILLVVVVAIAVPFVLRSVIRLLDYLRDRRKERDQ